jgi:hypothetical protein
VRSAGSLRVALNFDFGDTGGKYLVELENGVLNHTANRQASNADAMVMLTRNTLNDPSADQAGGRDQRRRRQDQRRPGEAGRGCLLPRHVRVLVQHRDPERDQLTKVSGGGRPHRRLPRVGQTWELAQ